MCKERTLGATESKRIKFVVSCLDSNKKKLNQGLVESHLTIFDTVSEKRFFMWLQIIANWEKKMEKKFIGRLFVVLFGGVVVF